MPNGEDDVQRAECRTPFTENDSGNRKYRKNLEGRPKHNVLSDQNVAVVDQLITKPRISAIRL